MFFAANFFGGVFSYMWKSLGLSHHIKDSMLQEAASFSAIVQTLTRFAVGYLYDKVGFKVLMYALMVINVLNSYFCYNFAEKEQTYAFLTSVELNYMVIGGVFALFPTACLNTFGPRFGAYAYCLLMMSVALASICNLLNVKLLFKIVGTEPILWVGTVLSVVAILINFFFTETLDFIRCDKKGVLEWGEVINQPESGPEVYHAKTTDGEYSNNEIE